MKLHSTLPERAGFLQALPIFDLFLLLLVLFLLGPSFVNQSGVQVELPLSRFRMPQHADATVVTLTRGDPPVAWLERERVSEVELIERLAGRRAELSGVPVLYLRSDGEVASRHERRIAELALQQGYRVFLLGAPEERE